MERTAKLFRLPLVWLWLPGFLLAPYLMYAIRGGIPGLLPGYLSVTYPMLSAAVFLLTRSSSRRALENNNNLFIGCGALAFFAAVFWYGWSLNPEARWPEAFNFHQELLDVERGGFFTHPTENRTEFAIHFSPVLFLLVPIFHLVPQPATIFVIGSLMMTLAIPAAMRFLRAKWSPSSAALLAFGAGLYPSLLSLHCDFSPVRFAPLAVWMMIIAYRERRPWRLVLAVIICWMVKETVLLAVIMLSATAYIERRSVRWYLPIAAAGMALFLITNQWILPGFAGTAGKTSTIAAQFGYWGETAPAVIMGFLSDPLSVLRAACRLNNLAYILKLAHPVLFVLPFGSPLLLIAAPEFFVNILAGFLPGIIDINRPGPWTSLVGHYSATIGTVIWAAATEAWAIRKKTDELSESDQENEWSRARLLFLAVLSSVIYPTNAETI